MTAVYVDTNILVHLLAGKPEEKARAVRTFIEASLLAKVELRVPVVVMHETWRTLARPHRLGAKRAAVVLGAVADSDDLVVEGRTVVVAALSTIAAQGVDFVDAYLAETARKDGSSVASFDRDFDKLDVERIEPGV